MTRIPGTVIAYDVRVNQKTVGQVFLRDEYWHAKGENTDKLARGGPGFVSARGYESRIEAGAALVKELVSS